MQFLADDPLQTLVFRQSQEVIDAVGLAPCHDRLAAEPAVAANHDLHLEATPGESARRSASVASPTRPPRRCRPAAAWHTTGGRRRRCTTAGSNTTCSSRERNLPNWSPCTGSSVASRSSTIRLRRPCVQLQKHVDEQRLRSGRCRQRSSCNGSSASAPRGVSSRRLSVFRPARALPRSRWRTRSGTGRVPLADQRGQQRIVPQLVVIVQIFVAQRQAEDPLPQQFLDRCARSNPHRDDR